MIPLFSFLGGGCFWAALAARLVQVSDFKHPLSTHCSTILEHTISVYLSQNQKNICLKFKNVFVLNFKHPLSAQLYNTWAHNISEKGGGHTPQYLSTQYKWKVGWAQLYNTFVRTISVNSGVGTLHNTWAQLYNTCVHNISEKWGGRWEKRGGCLFHRLELHVQDWFCGTTRPNC